MAATMYFSGIEKRTTADVLIAENASGMMSICQYTDQLVHDCKSISLVMDSGAFAKELTRQDIERYAQVILKHHARFAWFANCDSIGDQVKSNENYRFLLSLLPEHLHVQVLWIYQQGTDKRFLYDGLNQHTRVGIGGLVPLFSKNKGYAMAILQEIALAVRQHHVSPHYFGLASVDILRTLHQYHDDFSVDSTTWLVGGKYGAAINATGQQVSANAGGFCYSTHEILSQNVRTISKWMQAPARQREVNQQLPLFDVA